MDLLSRNAEPAACKTVVAAAQRFGKFLCGVRCTRGCFCLRSDLVDARVANEDATMTLCEEVDFGNKH